MALSKTVIAEHAAVASEQPLATLAGYDVLRNGGNAFDAAVAISYALSVTFHPAGGLGGDFFVTFYEAKSGKVHCLNSSGWAPSGLTLELIRSKGESRVPLYGPLSCVVPGQVAGVSSMHARFGRLEFKGLLSAASTLASKGFPAGEGICRSTAGAFDSLPGEARRIFAPSGKPPLPGEWVKQESLGRLIDEIAEGGEDAFYRGWPAEKIRATLQALGVPADESDFADFRPEWVEPIVFDYNGTRVHETPPNSMGATSLLMLKLLSEEDLQNVGPFSRERIELTMEAAEAAYARRDRILGDPRFGRFDFREFMTVPHDSEAYRGRVSGGDTTAFSIADSEGNLVSGIQSLFHHYGSRVFVPECGIMLNNRGSGFNVTGPNKLEPRKRPLHTLSSLILERDGRPWLAIGSSGGEYRPMQHTLFVTNLVDYSMPLEQAVEHPRFLWSGGRSLLVEAGYEGLDPSKYDVQRLPMPGKTGVCQGVEISTRWRKAVCDARGDGTPAGF